ncbi:54S ribosomal protein L40, mitochondrial [Candida viswanathii]|uniref:54S ribosomal protein L40, mitochondrial n=1 Tax=Candida viswanathii TaxID=5486 RepID=A0A367Y029_9ASCO|nr:54S ribosomal protein L40, mitochondrial [Candida viswanathii]
MSWVTKRTRFQKNILGLPEYLRKSLRKHQEAGSLPTLKGFFPDELPKSQRKTDVEAGIMQGDLAYITTGRHKGKIVEVLAYNSLTDTVMLSGISSKKILPKMYWPEGHESYVYDFPDFVPRKDVRLAGKERDERGNISYVVAEDVELRDEYYDDRFKKFIPRRFAKYHDNIEFPWPEPAEIHEGALSTPEHVVMERTFEFQSIAKSGIPKAALDKLRNPFSKYKKRLLSAYQVAKLKGPEMPLTKEQKIWLARSEKRKIENKPKYYPLSEEVQEFIGAKMAQHLNKIESPELRLHLEGLSKRRNPDFEKTLQIIEETRTAEEEQQQQQQQPEQQEEEEPLKSEGAAKDSA